METRNNQHRTQGIKDKNEHKNTRQTTQEKQGLISGDKISPVGGEVSKREGQSVTLTCNYETTSGYPRLYWFSVYLGVHITEGLTWELHSDSVVGKNAEHKKDNVLQPKGDVTVTEGEEVTLPCEYNTTSTNNNLFWYKQDGNNSPKFILRPFKGDKGNTPERFSSTLDSTLRSVPLKIQKLQLSDSACVLLCSAAHSDREIDRGVSCEDLTPVKKEEFSSEGSTVTLSYKYFKKATGGDEFYWYRQYPGKPPQFLIFHLGTQNATKPGLSVKVSEDKTQMDLQISSAAVTDSAVYYCAVRPTVTGNSKTLYKNLWSKDNRILHNVH
ncbi:hypothetical protein L3Q82_005944 [Scortum barcoo]|uniref:Uncharacterized protein n=1 Tax=Scortum barcoo TaxID=214431 RepID=A0ACB8X3E5_9TELE|nr:hypothetical protein L3Q82_005944 [Scortum barcoo]